MVMEQTWLFGPLYATGLNSNHDVHSLCVLRHRMLSGDETWNMMDEGKI